MSFILKSGNVQVEYWPKTASTAFAVGVAVVMTSGALAVASSTDLSIVGVVAKPVVSTDTDYASTTSIPVLVPSPDAIWEIDVENSGTATSANVGIKYDLNSSTGTGINLSGTSHKQVTVVGVLSATKVLGRINASYEFVNAV